MNKEHASILVVEDSATQAAALAVLLEGAGYKTIMARRAEAALEVLGAQQVDLVLSDVVMPGMDGYELCRQIRAVPAWNHLPVVLLTSLTDPLAIVRGLASGAEHYVTKPYDAGALLERVAAVLARKHPADGPRPRPFTVELLGTPFTIGATKEHILELLVSSYSDLVRTSEAVREAERRARFLADVTSLLTASLDVQQVLRDLARLVAPRIADLCAIDILAPDGSAERVILARSEGDAKVGDAIRKPPLPPVVERAIEQRSIQVVTSVDSATLDDILRGAEPPHPLGTEEKLTLAVVPLVGRERVLAVVHCIATSSGSLTAAETTRLLEDVARRAALALENASLYAEAQRATRARDDVLAVVSHDLRNPLNTIQMSASFLLDVISDDVPRATLESQLQVIRRATRRANALIQDLLDVSRIDAGHLAVDAQTASAASLIADATLELGPLVTGSGLKFDCGWRGDDVEVKADRGRMIQVFSNLVGNAVKFTLAGGTISMHGRADEGGARFYVSDTGSGIDPEHLGHLFDRFWKASQGSRSGAGLGLSIARGIIESHSGLIQVSSEPGVGTTFTFTLPAERVP